MKWIRLCIFTLTILATAGICSCSNDGTSYTVTQYIDSEESSLLTERIKELFETMKKEVANHV